MKLQKNGVFMSLQRILSDNMKRFRKKTGITQARLAEIINSSTNYIAEIETLKKFPSPGKLEDIAKALKVEPYELIMPINEVLNSEDKKSITYKITSEIRTLLDNVENQYSPHIQEDNINKNTDR